MGVFKNIKRKVRNFADTLSGVDSEYSHIYDRLPEDIQDDMDILENELKEIEDDDNYKSAQKEYKEAQTQRAECLQKKKRTKENIKELLKDNAGLVAKILKILSFPIGGLIGTWWQKGLYHTFLRKTDVGQQYLSLNDDKEDLEKDDDDLKVKLKDNRNIIKKFSKRREKVLEELAQQKRNIVKKSKPYKYDFKLMDAYDNFSETDKNTLVNEFGPEAGLEALNAIEEYLGNVSENWYESKAIRTGLDITRITYVIKKIHNGEKIVGKDKNAIKTFTQRVLHPDEEEHELDEAEAENAHRKKTNKSDKDDVRNRNKLIVDFTKYPKLDRDIIDSIAQKGLGLTAEQYMAFIGAAIKFEEEAEEGEKFYPDECVKQLKRKSDDILFKFANYGAEKLSEVIKGTEEPSTWYSLYFIPREDYNHMLAEKTSHREGQERGEGTVVSYDEQGV